MHRGELLSGEKATLELGPTPEGLYHGLKREEPDVIPGLAVEREPDKHWPLHGEDLSKTLHDRGSKYGDYGIMSALIQVIKSLMQSSPNWDRLPPQHKEALDLIATKQGRILCGDFLEADHWRDIAGYATLGEDHCHLVTSSKIKEKI